MERFGLSPLIRFTLVEPVRGVGAALARLGPRIVEAVNGCWPDSRACVGCGFAERAG
jgi:hypothetical protein